MPLDTLLKMPTLEMISHIKRPEMATQLLESTGLLFRTAEFRL